MPDLSMLAQALRDPEYYRSVASGLLDATNRGAIGGLLGAPVDAVNGLLNAGKMATGYIGHKTGLLSADQMPQPDTLPIGGSEWWGQQMQNSGMVTPQRNAPAEFLAGLAGMPAMYKATAFAGPKIESALSTALRNAQAPTPYNTATGGQAGMVNVKWPKYDSGLYVTEGLENRGREVIQSQAEMLAQRLRDAGVSVDVQHSGSAAGPSSYLRVAGMPEIRVSGHSKGVFNSGGVLNVASPSEFDSIVNKAVEASNRINAQREASAISYEDAALPIRLKSAQKKLSKGVTLTNAEREAAIENGLISVENAD